MRWQRGTVESLWRHREMLMNPRFGVVGLFAFPYFAVFEMLGPAVEFFARRGLPRSASILSTYLAIFAAIVGIGSLIVPPVVNGVDSLSKDIPGYIQDLRKSKSFRKYDNRYHISKKLNEQAQKLPSRLGDAAGALQSVTVGVFSAIVQLINDTPHPLGI